MDNPLFHFQQEHVGFIGTYICGRLQILPHMILT